MNHDPNDQKTDTPFFPSGYSPEVQEDDSGYNNLLHIQQSQYSGPIPPPDSLQHYEEILPGAADRILRMAEESARSIRESNSKQLIIEESIEQHRHDETKRGQNFGLATVISMVALAGLAILCGYPIIAGTICSITVIGVAAVFVTGRNIKSKESTDEP
jgi:uncharacterized membrane protein